MIALLDGDLYAFRCAATCQHIVDGFDEHGKAIKLLETLPVHIAYARCNEMVEKTLLELDTQDYEIYLTDSRGNFRKTIDPEYKANRAKLERPVHLKALEEFLIKEWGAIRAVEEESDDRLGIEQTKYLESGEDESVIVSIDKDLLTIEGNHYNFVKQEFTTITPEEAQFKFYCQLLKGDPTDGIGGCPGIGDKKADKFLRPHYGNEMELYREVFEQYKKAFPNQCDDEIEELITMVGRLVYIRRHEGELWSIPTFKD